MVKTILVVDDDPQVLSFLEQALSADGWRVLTEREGRWALKVFRSTPVDAAILDILLPDQSGLEVAEEIRATGAKDLPIIVLSGVYRSEDFRREATERLGLLAFLQKPASSAEIRGLLREHFGEEYPSGGSRGRRRARPTFTARLAAAAEKVAPKQPERPKLVVPRPVPLRGDLAEVPFPLLLRELRRLEATGALFLLGGKVRKVVYVSGGRPVFVKSNLLPECLGQLLLAEGLITEAECEEALERSKRSGRLQGAELVAMGAIVPGVLSSMLRVQLRLKLLQVFSWRGGLYQFRENVALPQVLVEPDFTIPDLVYEGMRDFMPPEVLEVILGPAEEAYLAPARDPAMRYQLLDVEDEEELRLLELVDGTRTGAELVEATPLSRERARLLLGVLLVSGKVEGWDRPVPQRPLFRKRDLLLPQGLADTETRAHLAAQLVDLAGRTCAEILGIAGGADSVVIEDRYSRLMCTYHPDRFLDYEPETRALAEQVFDVLRACGARLQESGEPGDTVVLAKEDLGPEVLALAASRAFAEGESLLGRGRPAEARRLLDRAAELVPDNGGYRAAAAWALYQELGDEVVMEAEDRIRGATQAPEGADVAYFYLGKLYEDLGDEPGARRAYENALRCNSSCTRALEALEALSIRA